MYTQKIWKYFFMIVLVLVSAGCADLTKEERQKLEDAMNRIRRVESDTAKKIEELKVKHQKGILTTLELQQEIDKILQRAETEIKQARKEIEEIYNAAKSRGSKWYEILGSILGTALLAGVGIKSPGAIELARRLRRGNEKGIQSRKSN